MVSRTTGLAAHRRARQGLRRDPLQSDNARTTIFDDREDDGGKGVSVEERHGHRSRSCCSPGRRSVVSGP